MSFMVMGKKLNTSAASWGWFCVWLKQDYKAFPIEITDNGETAKIKIKKPGDANWLNAIDAVDILRTLFKYHYIAEQAYGTNMTPDAFETFADEWWREISAVVLSDKDGIIVKKY